MAMAINQWTRYFTKKASKLIQKIDYKRELDMQIAENLRLKTHNQLEASSKSLLRNLKAIPQSFSQSRIQNKNDGNQVTIKGIISEEDRK